MLLSLFAACAALPPVPARAAPFSVEDAGAAGAAAVVTAGAEAAFTGEGGLPAGAPEIPATEGYPLVLTRGDGSKLYVSCLAFYDPVPPALATAEPALQVGSLRRGRPPSSRL